MANMEGVAVGDTVLHITRYQRGRGPEPVTVAKVGRTLLHVTIHGRSHKFRKDSGMANDGYGHSHIITFAELAEREKRSAALEDLTSLGLGPVNSWKCSLTSAQLEAAAAAIRASA